MADQSGVTQMNSEKLDNLKKASDIFITESDDLPQVMAEEATSVGGVPEPSVIADFNVSFFFFTVILI